MVDSTRRQFLRVGGMVSAIGLAGCNQIANGTTDSAGGNGEATTERTVSNGKQSVPEVTEGYTDEFERTEISELRVVDGGENLWTISEGIDGRSLTGTGGGSRGEGGRIRYDSEQYQWTGDRKMSLQFKADTSYSKRHAQLYFWDDESYWQVAASLPLNLLRLRHEEQDSIQDLPINVETPMDSTETHKFAVVIRGDTITVGFDGQEHIEHTHSQNIGGGSVGFGIGFERSTSYDSLEIELL